MLIFYLIFILGCFQFGLNAAKSDSFTFDSVNSWCAYHCNKQTNFFPDIACAQKCPTLRRIQEKNGSSKVIECLDLVKCQSRSQVQLVLAEDKQVFKDFFDQFLRAFRMMVGGNNPQIGVCKLALISLPTSRQNPQKQRANATKVSNSNQ